MAKRKDTPAEQAAETDLPEKVQLEQDFTFWFSPYPNAEMTMQFYANQVVTDPHLVSLLIGHNAPLKG